MATLSTIKGRRIVQVKVAGKRRTIHLGRMSERDARGIKAHIEHLQIGVESALPIPPETAAWVAKIPFTLHSKLVKAELTVARGERVECLIGPYFDRYINGRTDLKPRTLENLKQAKRSIVEFFGESRAMVSITRGDVKDWHRHESAKRAAATVSMYVKKIRQVYADAVDRKLITENPFRAVKAGSMKNAERQVYIAVADIEKVIGYCTDAEWKLLFALARYAGLRVPSETRSLRWTDILWDQNRMRIHSSKTEHHEGKEKRLVPIFPEILPHLLRLQSESPEGQNHVFRRLRGDNLSTTGDKLIERAGLSPWVKPWQNLRSSCETDLAAWLPMHVVCAWIGNSENVAIKHYLQVTDQHFDMATGAAASGAAKSAAVSAGHDRTNADQRIQKPRFSGAFVRSIYPQGESNSAGNSIDLMQAAHLALQNALHGLRKSDERSIAHLEREVRTAKGRVR